jgi:hypothetical protein
MQAHLKFPPFVYIAHTWAPHHSGDFLQSSNALFAYVFGLEPLTLAPSICIGSDGHLCLYHFSFHFGRLRTQISPSLPSDPMHLGVSAIILPLPYFCKGSGISFCSLFLCFSTFL